MTDHEQPAAGVALKPHQAAACKFICTLYDALGPLAPEKYSREEQHAIFVLSSYLEYTPTDAGGAVSEALRAAQTFIDEYFVATDDNEDAALTEISDTIEAALSAPQPLQQGGEVTRAMIEAILAKHLANNPSQIAFGNATDAILALFASIAADRDKAVGLIKRLLDADADATKNPMGGLSLGGLMDCRDNSGCVYQSADLADILAKISAFLSSQTEGI